jgi:thiamine-monophosphate kinase
MSATVGQTGERALIERLRARLAAPPPDVLVGVGDDAAVVEPPRGALEVLTTDALVDGVHFDRRFCSAADVGHRALAVNLSDLAAMGATPRFALLSIGLPGTLPLSDFDGALEGFLALAGRYQVSLIGGNITRTEGPWFLDVTAIGSVRRRRALTRAGGRAGDELYVTGQLGGARAGLAWLHRVSGTLVGAATTSSVALEDAAARYRQPAPRVRQGLLVARNKAASACMDLSDGLADAVTQVAAASGTGALIDAAALPVHDAVRALWPDDAVRQSLFGGDDYELLFAVPRRRRRAFLAALGQGRHLPVTRIGRLTSDTEGLRVAGPDGSTTPLPAGYEHFRAPAGG